MTTSTTTPALVHKSLGVEGCKVLDASEGIVEAYVSGIGNKDSGGDIIVPGAFDTWLPLRKPKGVWSHDWDKPVSKTLEIYEVLADDPRLPLKLQLNNIGGLYVKTQFNMNTQLGRDAFETVRFYGDEAEWSIGYQVHDQEFDKKLGAMILKEIELYEYSPVLFGMNALTATVSVKVHQLEDGELEYDVKGLNDLESRAVSAALKVILEEKQITVDPQEGDKEPEVSLGEKVSDEEIEVSTDEEIEEKTVTQEESEDVSDSQEETSAKTDEVEADAKAEEVEEEEVKVEEEDDDEVKVDEVKVDEDEEYEDDEDEEDEDEDDEDEEEDDEKALVSEITKAVIENIMGGLQSVLAKEEDSEAEVKEEDSEAEVKEEDSEAEVKEEDSEAEVKEEDSEAEVKEEDSEAEVKEEDSEAEVKEEDSEVDEKDDEVEVEEKTDTEDSSEDAEEKSEEVEAKEEDSEVEAKEDEVDEDSEEKSVEDENSDEKSDDISDMDFLKGLAEFDEMLSDTL